MEKVLVKKFIKGIEGYLEDKEGEFLYDLVKDCDDKGVIVEIGSYQGKSAIWLGAGSSQGNKIKVYTIDPHLWENNLNKLKGNIHKAGLDNIIIPISRTSQQAARNFDYPIQLLFIIFQYPVRLRRGLLEGGVWGTLGSPIDRVRGLPRGLIPFIDGDHDLKAVQTDFNNWAPKVVNNGLIVFHDVITDKHKGPRQVIEKRILKSKNFSNIKWVETILIAHKCKANFYNLLKKYILFILIHFQLIIIIRKTEKKINQFIGLIGEFIKKYFPKLYYLLKNNNEKSID